MRFTRWNQKDPEGYVPDELKQLVSWHAQHISNPSHRRFADGVARGDVALLDIINYEIDYTHGFRDAEEAYHLRCIMALFSKRDDLSLGIDRKAVALKKFRECESKCADTNLFFRQLSKGNVNVPRDVAAVLFAAQRKISCVLGKVPDLSSLRLRFGPGATTQTKRKISSPREKLGKTFCCSEDLVPTVSNLLAEMPAWVPFGESESAIVSVVIHPCKLSFVPKNAKTDRGICTEPSLNVMLQLGIGQHIADRLKRFGVDISDQSANQRAAKEGSLTGALATLDLSSASDLIAKELVFHLLPIDWFFFLSSARSAMCVVDGEEVRLEKFSSMGNGFTFPLETLIFWAIASASVEVAQESGPIDRRVWVYGDDIIVATAAVPLVVRCLTASGFVINTDKSFFSGPFRESCGADYYLGTDIRPCYLKSSLSAEGAFTLHNYYVRRGLSEAAEIVVQSIAPHIKLWGPDGYGDGHLIGDYPRVRKLEHVRKGFGGYTFDTFTSKPLKQFRKELPGDHVWPCYSIYANPPTDLLAEVRKEGPRGDRSRAMCSERSQSVFYGSGGELGVPTPGKSGYKRVSIYVLG